jgi:hypothetical protein
VQPEFRDHIRAKDSVAIRRWLSCGYQAQGLSILDLVKGLRDPELVAVRDVTT